MKVFLVDDSPEIRERLSGMLYGLKGVEIVGQADRAATAISSIRAIKPDVVLLDIQLIGHETGIDVLEQIEREKPAPKVIMLTNYPYPQYRKRCLEAGADFFFDKSIEFDDLVPVIQKLAMTNESSNGRPSGRIDDTGEPTNAMVYTTMVYRSRDS
ncbi:MAG: response regulator transcription factor [Chloroflexi bacterium]|nr:response regulator transcription factor [Chloroflexota bacterium]